LDEKYQKISQINSNYNSQIKEIDLITTKDDYEKSSHLKAIIDSLIEEQKLEIRKTEDLYDKLIDDYEGEIDGHSNKSASCKLSYNIFKQISNVYDLKK